MKRLFIGLICLWQSTHVFAWNALGHRLVAQIAYDYLTPHARQIFDQYNQSMDKVYKPQTFANAAVWLDTLRYQEINWFVTMHYVDLPFSDDATPLPAPQLINALWAIEKSNALLLNKYATNFDKGTALRVMLHVVGDIHQPLHAATKVNRQYPEGDRGGNLVILKGNRVAKNLHAYWDRGAGFLISKRRYTQLQMEQMARNIEQQWPCDLSLVKIDPRSWAEESHALAVTKAYQALPKNNSPDKTYQDMTQAITTHQIALAGCHLAALLNRIDDKLIQKSTRNSEYSKGTSHRKYQRSIR